MFYLNLMEKKKLVEKFEEKKNDEKQKTIYIEEKINSR